MLKSMKQLGDRLEKKTKKGEEKKFKKAETVVAYQRKAPSSTTAPKSISKADAEAKMGRMENMFEEQRGIEEGERQFGSGYKEMDLKATRQKTKDLKGNESVKTTFRSNTGNEEVSKIPDSDMVEVKSIGEYEQAGLGGTSKQSIRDYLESVKARKRAKIQSILNKTQPQREKIMAEIEAAKSKAGGNK